MGVVVTCWGAMVLPDWVGATPTARCPALDTEGPAEEGALVDAGLFGLAVAPGVRGRVGVEPLMGTSDGLGMMDVVAIRIY